MGSALAMGTSIATTAAKTILVDAAGDGPACPVVYRGRTGDPLSLLN